jgi:glutamate racemase
MNMPARAAQPIGIFDSGIGGATVLRELHLLLPHEDILFLADQANVPYGPRATNELRALSAANTYWLRAHGAKIIVVACNTASAAALQWLRAEFPALSFVGMVPAVKPAAAQTHSGVVGVLATPATLQGELLDEVVLRWAGGTTVVRQGCPGLVEQIEAGAFDSPTTLEMLKEFLQPLLAAGADTIVLGCTHYPFVAPQIQQLAGPQVQLIDAAPAVARQTLRVLAEHGLVQPHTERRGEITYATTGSPAALARLIAQLGLPPGRVIHAST